MPAPHHPPRNARHFAAKPDRHPLQRISNPTRHLFLRSSDTVSRRVVDGSPSLEHVVVVVHDIVDLLRRLALLVVVVVPALRTIVSGLSGIVSDG